MNRKLSSYSGERMRVPGRPPRRKRRKYSRIRNRILILLAAAALLSVIILAVAGRGGERREGEATIRIEPGTSTAQIARMLKDEDVIDSEKDFLKEAERTGIAESLQAGTYRFTRGEPIKSILAKLESGIHAPEGVLTVPEGFSLNEIAVELSTKTPITASQYLKEAVPAGRVLPLSGSESAQDLEGLLFPSTYDLEPGITARTLVDRQLETFRKQTSTLPWEKAGTLGLTEYEVLIVASLVEREARVPEERPQVAAVIYNRMRAGMKLEVDATVQYALGFWKQELTQSDLETDSPYNTRLNPGLPPGPICNPGVDSIRAALEPADVDYLYYVATGDEEGHHFFTASYEEFLQQKDASE